MPFFLLQLSLEQIADIALFRIPTGIISIIEEDALPTQFIASRSLAQLADGKPDYWCCTFLIWRIADNRVVGACGFKNQPTAGRVEIGYGVSPICRKQGAATEAGNALCWQRSLPDDFAKVAAVLLLPMAVSTASSQRRSIALRNKFRRHRIREPDAVFREIKQVAELLHFLRIHFQHDRLAMSCADRNRGFPGRRHMHMMA